MHSFQHLAYKNGPFLSRKPRIPCFFMTVRKKYCHRFSVETHLPHSLVFGTSQPFSIFFLWKLTCHTPWCLALPTQCGSFGGRWDLDLTRCKEIFSIFYLNSIGKKHVAQLSELYHPIPPKKKHTYMDPLLKPLFLTGGLWHLHVGRWHPPPLAHDHRRCSSLRSPSGQNSMMMMKYLVPHGANQPTYCLDTQKAP